MIPIVTHTEGAFEPDELRAAAEQHDRFLFLKDSLRILDPERFWSTIAAVEGGAWLLARPSCYVAIYDSATLRTALENAPHSGDKQASIIWESRLHDLLNYPTIWPDITDRNPLRLEHIGDGIEFVIGNQIVEKYKGTARCRFCPGTSGICRHLTRRAIAAATSRRHRLER